MKLIKFIFSKWFVLNVFVAIIVVGFGLYSVKGLLSSLTLHGETITVPDLSTYTLDEVKDKLDDLSLDFRVIDSSEYTTKFPKNSVVRQDPKGGSLVKEGRVIYLTINPSEYRSVEVPYLVGQTSRQAVSYLKSVGFRIGKIEYRPDIGKNVVLDLTYQGEVLDSLATLPKESIIGLVLGDGEKGEKAILPNLIGEKYDGIQEKLLKLSLNLGKVSFDGEENDSLKYFIFKQFPKHINGGKLKLGSSIDLWVTTDSLKLQEVQSDSLNVDNGSADKELF